MTFTLVTYGAGEILHVTFNAIAALINSHSGSLYQPLVRFALITGLVWATASMVYGDKMKFLNSWVIPLYLSLTLFFAPTCTVIISDPVSHNRYKVDNVPWGLGATAGIISQLGDAMTRKIEMTFSLPDDLKYHKTGAMMASNLIAESRTFQITNADLRETMKSFVTQCVVYDALLGQKYTFDDLTKSTDLWGLISANPSPARAFMFKAPGRGSSSEIKTCAEGVNLIKPYLELNRESAFQYFERKIFGAPLSSTDANSNVPVTGQILKQYLPGALNYMTQMSQSANEYMMQQMMIYSVVDAVESKSTELGNAPNFAVRRAYLQQRATQETIAGIAANKLIAMKNVMEVLIYASFLFILPLALLPLGWQYIGRWIGLVMWVQLWPPLYAILNFIMTISARSQSLGAISDPKGSGITIANSVGFCNLHADMAAQAGFMSLAVGSLAYALVKGGAASFVHLASHMAGPASTAASQSSESLMSGNYSFGNISSGTVTANNTTFGQHQASPSYSSGSFSQNDGMVSRATSGDGGHVVSVAISQLRSAINFSEGLSNSYTEQAAEASQLAKSQLASAGEALSDHNRQLIDYATHRSKQLSSGEHFAMNENTSQSKSMTEIDGLVDRFAKDHNLTKEDAGQILAKASATTSVGGGFSLFGFGASVQGSVEGAVSNTWSKIDRDTWTAAQDYSKTHNLQNALNQTSQAMRDSKYSDSSDEGKRLSSSLSSSYDKSNHYREEANKSLQQSQSYSEMASKTRQNANQINANLNQEYVNWLQTQSLPNSSGSMGIKEAETILSSRPELDYQYQQKFMESKMGTSGMGRSYMEAAPSRESLSTGYKALNLENAVTSKGFETVRENGAQDGLGDTFKIDKSAKGDVQNQLSEISDQISEQTDMLVREAAIRRDGYGS